MTTPKIFIVGLDAATLSLIRPWAEQGLLPHFDRLLKDGASGALSSTLPPITPPAWTSFMTGKNPGKHGLFHFVEPQPGAYTLRYTNAGSRKARTLWRILSDAGYTVGVMNTPFTYPPEPVNGFQISGMDTPSPESPFIHPPSLRKELEQAIGKISLDIRYLGFMSTDERRDQVLAEIEKLDRQWTEAGLYLLEKHPADVMMFTYTSVDTAQHYFWHYMDPHHFLHDPQGVSLYGKTILQVYQRMDDAIGRFMNRLPKETTVVVVSDHGAGPISDRLVYLNRHLSQLGLLKYRDHPNRWSPERAIQKLLRRVDSLLRGSLSSRQKSALARLFPRLRQKVETSSTSFAAIDWSSTKAYCSEMLASPPNIWINLRGARPSGIVEPHEYKTLIDKISKSLYELKDPRTAQPVIKRVYHRDEIYQGPYADQAPDLTLDWWSDDAFATRPSFPEDRNEPVVVIRDRKPPKGSEWSGTHRLEGTLIIQGEAIKQGDRVNQAGIIDLAPTLLHLLGLPVPDDMDGRVLTDLIRPDFMDKHPIRYQKTAQGEPGQEPGAEYSDEESSKIEERLKGLGYIE